MTTTTEGRRLTGKMQLSFITIFEIFTKTTVLNSQQTNNVTQKVLNISFVNHFGEKDLHTSWQGVAGVVGAAGKDFKVCQKFYHIVKP